MNCHMQHNIRGKNDEKKDGRSRTFISVEYFLLFLFDETNKRKKIENFHIFMSHLRMEIVLAIFSLFNCSRTKYPASSQWWRGIWGEKKRANKKVITIVNGNGNGNSNFKPNARFDGIVTRKKRPSNEMNIATWLCDSCTLFSSIHSFVHLFFSVWHVCVMCICIRACACHHLCDVMLFFSLDRSFLHLICKIKPEKREKKKLAHARIHTIRKLCFEKLLAFLATASNHPSRHTG